MVHKRKEHIKSFNLAMLTLSLNLVTYGINEMCSSTTSVKIFPETVRSLSVGHLHLPLSLSNKLTHMGITTIGNLFDELDSGFKSISEIKQNHLDIITRALIAISEATSQDGVVDWIKYCRIQEIELLPKQHDFGLNHKQVLQQIPKVIKEVLCHALSDRDWQIIERRFELSGKQKLTLEELGMAFDGLTRERIRQIEKKALTLISHVFIENQYSGKNYRVYPDIIYPIKLMFDILATDTKEFILETNLFRLIEETFDIDFKSVKSTLILLFNVAGMTRIEFNNLSLVPIWQRTETNQRPILEYVLKHIDDILTNETALPMDELDILVNIKKRIKKTKKLNPLQLRHFLDLCSSVEKCGESLWRGKFEHLKGRGNQAERILLELNQPTSAAEIAREINKRLVPLNHRKVETRNLVNQLISDRRFVAIGRSGEWGLKSWQLDTDSIVDLMEKYLIENNKSASVNEIYDYVRSRRSVSINSIKLYLQSKADIFGKADRVNWGLVSWKEVQNAKTWSPEEVATFISSIFRKHRKKELEYKLLSLALSTEAGVSIRKAQGMLNYNPVIQTYRSKKAVTYAVFQPDYQNKLTDRTVKLIKSPRKSQREEVQETAEQLLSASPQKQILLSELVVNIVEACNIPKAAVYRYISESNFIKKAAIPGSQTKMCQLQQDKPIIFQQLDLLPEKYATEARRAISKLTIDEVDIGLFLLGRLFEGVLKEFILTVEQMNNYKQPPPNDKKLANLVAWVKKEGIISDSTILQVLREERNERAHGQAPPIEERQRILEGVEWVVNRYLDHILLFTQKHEKLLKKT